MNKSLWEKAICFFPFSIGGKAMKIKYGNTIEEFNTELQKLNSKSCAVISKAKSEINISMQFDNKELEKWTIKRSTNGLRLPKKKIGKKYDAFLNALQDFYKINQIMDAQSCDTVLCYRDTEKNKSMGKVVSNWFQLDLGLPYELVNGQPHFEVLRLELSEWEYEKMMETRLAFMHDEIIYPISNVAIHSVGTYLDCSVAFRTIDTCPLGSAILMAEKFSNLKNLQIIYRECTKKIRPILSVGGRDFVHIPITEFFNKAIANIPSLYTLEKWYVTDMDACAYFSVYGYDKNLVIKIEGGDLPGKSMRVSAVLLYHGQEFPLRTNRMSHKGELAEKQYKELFYGIYHAFDCYNNKRNDIISCPNLSKIKSCLGKKRCKDIDFDTLHSLQGTRDEVVKKIIDTTYVELKSRQKEELEQFIGSLFMED